MYYQPQGMMAPGFVGDPYADVPNAPYSPLTRRKRPRLNSTPDIYGGPQMPDYRPRAGLGGGAAPVTVSWQKQGGYPGMGYQYPQNNTTRSGMGRPPAYLGGGGGFRPTGRTQFQAAGTGPGFNRPPVSPPTNNGLYGSYSSYYG